MAPSTDTADYSNGTAQMATHLMPLHTVSLLTPASADLPRCLEVPGRLLQDNVVVVVVDVYRRTLRHASQKEHTLAVNHPRFGSLKHKSKTFPPSWEIEALTTMIVGDEDTTSTTTTKFGLETLMNDEVAIMPRAVEAELSTTLRQRTETSMMMMMIVVEGETSETSSNDK
jgi:hypothetical protein